MRGNSTTPRGKGRGAGTGPSTEIKLRDYIHGQISDILQADRRQMLAVRGGAAGGTGTMVTAASFVAGAGVGAKAGSQK